MLHAVRLDSGEAGIDYSDLGRKWRSALGQLGFLAGHLTRGHRDGADPRLEHVVLGVEGLTARPYEITPNGRRLVRSDDLPAQQECFLRALVGYRIPSVLEPHYRCQPFSPLHFVLEIFHTLNRRGTEDVISFQEMALLVQRGTAEEGADFVAERIETFRASRAQSAGSLALFDRQAYEVAVSEDWPGTPSDRVASRANTLNDYADLTLRYLKATGLFKSKGRGIALAAERAQLATRVREEGFATLDDDSYLRQLWTGAGLPTDDRSGAVSVIEDLVSQLQRSGAEPDVGRLQQLDIGALAETRHRLEGQVRLMGEEAYAAQQVAQLDEILGWMDAILARGRATLPDGTKITVPRNETPAYLEWVIWRAFLALNSLQNKPWDARRFHIDQDYLPIGPAPGGGPDMVFVFSDATLVVEVTLTSSSRQEAAEGEPVRRHVARYAEDDNAVRPVYGLFIAPVIDTNTAHTFKNGDWYMQDDTKINLHIVPLRPVDFRRFFEASSARISDAPARLQQLLAQCRMEANQDAPRWKQTITRLTEQMAESLTKS